MSIPRPFKAEPPPKPPPGGCTCGKGKVGGLLCAPCFVRYDDERPRVTVDSGGVHFHPARNPRRH